MSGKMKIILFILFSFLLVICNTNYKNFDIQNLNGNKITVIGHRGMGTNHKFPGNTLESIYTALNLGADGVEIDVQLTKDSVLVIYHNKDLSSSTNFEGRIIDFNWSDLENCKDITKDGSSYPIINIDSLFNWIPNIHKYHFSFDLKLNYGDIDTAKYLQSFAYAIDKVVEDYNMHHRVLVETGNLQLHQLLKTDRVQVLQFITGRNMMEGIRIAKDLDLYGVGIGSSITRKEVELAHSNNLRVMTWIPKSKWGNIKAVRKNPDFLQTDKLEHLIQILKHPNFIN